MLICAQLICGTGIRGSGGSGDQGIRGSGDQGIKGIREAGDQGNRGSGDQGNRGISQTGIVCPEKWTREEKGGGGEEGQTSNKLRLRIRESQT